MNTTVTCKIKIPKSDGVVNTVRAFRDALQYCVGVARERNIRNNVKLQPFVYKTIRERYGLPSQLAISCVKQACGMMKKTKRVPVIKNASVGYNFPRSANIQGNTLSFRTLTGRERCAITIPSCYAEYFSSWEVSESLLVIDRKQRAFFCFVFTKDIAERQVVPRVLGVDLGINNLAVTSDARFFNDGNVKRAKRKFKFLRATLQAKGTRASKRLLKRLAGRETRYMAWVNHNISKAIVNDFDGDTIVLEDLKGIRHKQRGRVMNYWIHNWSYAQLGSFIDYKARMRGITTVKVNPFMTSKMCHQCGLVGVRSHGCFSCERCGLKDFSADLNAARNLAHPKLVERQAGVNQPYLTCDEAPRSRLRSLVVEHSQKPRILDAR
jgi:IS605 OrfB family transposase